MWVIATLASLALLIILILCIPLNVTLLVDIHGRPRFRTRLVWLFGLVSKEIKKGSKKSAEKSRTVPDKRKPGVRRANAKVVVQILRTKGLLGQLKRLLKEIFRHLKIRDLSVNLRIGLDDPADTGLLFAVIGPGTLFLKSAFSHQIRLQPAFTEAVFEGDLSGALRLQPIRLVIPLLRFALSLPTIRVLKIVVWYKWKRKK